MLAIVVLGIIAISITNALIMPPSRELMLKLGTLVDMARRGNPELFRTQVEPISPFVGRSFKHSRVTKMLRADLSQFDPITQRLQLEARKLDRKVHWGLLPALTYFAGLGLWYALR